MNDYHINLFFIEFSSLLFWLMLIPLICCSEPLGGLQSAEYGEFPFVDVSYLLSLEDHSRFQITIHA